MVATLVDTAVHPSYLYNSDRLGVTFGEADKRLPEAVVDAGATVAAELPLSASLRSLSKCRSYAKGSALAGSFRDGPNRWTMSCRTEGNTKQTIRTAVT